jgi:putative nucleotidyltransferase with HDIG domain
METKKSKLTDFLFKAAARAMYIMNADVCGIWLKDRQENFLPQVYYGIERQFATALFSNENGDLLQRFLKNATSLQMHNPDKNCSRQTKRHIQAEGVKTLLMSPVIAKETIIGIIAVGTKKEYRDFLQVEQMTFSALADEIALFIQTERLSEKAKESYLNTIRTISLILEANDEYTYGHSHKVMNHAVSMGRMMKLNDSDVNLIKNAALLHDIGKIGIDSDILHKKGKLTVCEWEQVKEHPVIGAAIIEQTGFLNELIPVVKHHHERFGGGGYPDAGLANGNIPLGARIITVADSYDAMTSARPYRTSPFSPQAALQELQANTGNQFDPELISIFTAYMTEQLKADQR